MTLSKTLIPALILLFGSGWVIAEMAEKEFTGTLPYFTQVDADQNGGIPKTEARVVPGLVEVFARADIDSNGWLNQGEYLTVRQVHEGETSSPPEG